MSATLCMNSNNEGPLQNICFSDLSSAFQKKNFTGSPPNSGIYGNSLTEIQKTSNIFNSEMKNKLLKGEKTLQTMQKGFENNYFYKFWGFFEVGEWELMGAVKKFSKKMIGLLQSRNLKKMTKFHYSILKEDFDTCHEVFFWENPFFFIIFTEKWAGNEFSYNFRILDSFFCLFFSGYSFSCYYPKQHFENWLGSYYDVGNFDSFLHYLSLFLFSIQQWFW